MPPAATATVPPAGSRAAGQAAPPPAMPPVAFEDGTYDYSQTIATYTLTPGAGAQDFPITNITPGGFLKGVLLVVSSAGGVIGTGVLGADAPWNLFSNIALESIDGAPIIYPDSGYHHYLVSKYCRGFDGDPILDPFFLNTINPAFRLRFFLESRATLGVWPNTDARAQYRLRMQLAPISVWLSTVGTATAPVVTVSVVLEVYAQPPDQSLTGAPIEQQPKGRGVQRFISDQQGIPLPGGTTTVRLTRAGNLIRTHILEVRSSAGARIDLTADPIRFRVDNTEIFAELRSHRDYEMFRIINGGKGSGAALAPARETGVYVFSRWQATDSLEGMGWLETTPATYLAYELPGTPAGGSLNVITEDLAPVGGVPAGLAHI